MTTTPTGTEGTPPAALVEAPSDVTHHVVSYADWRNGGRTTCCGRPVSELPKTDVCGPYWQGREPDHRRCSALNGAGKPLQPLGEWQ